MGVDAILEDDRWAAIGLAALADRAAAACLTRLGHDPGRFEIGLMGCDDARIAALNAEFRALSRPTNVLSWPSRERGADTPGEAPRPPVDAELGDIAIAWETCAREAAAAGKSMSDHVTHLVVHAVLHLLGYDHQTDADAALMERAEVAILAELGLDNPYD